MIIFNPNKSIEELAVEGCFLKLKDINNIKSIGYTDLLELNQPKKILEELSNSISPLIKKNDKCQFDYTCFDVSLAYICIGQHLGLPLFGVNTPDHFFVRWDKKPNKINFEPLQRIFSEDKQYVEAYGLLNSNIYLKSLSKLELISCMYVNFVADLLERGEYDLAEEACTSAINLNNQNLEARYNLAKIKLYQKNLKPAEQISYESLTLNNNDPRFLQLLGDIKMAQSETIDAISYYARSVSVEYNLLRKIETLEKNALANISLGDIASAKLNYIDILKINPSIPEVYNNLSNLSKEESDVVTAKQFYKKALQLKPQFKEAKIISRN